MSGVKINERCLSEFQEFKLRGKSSYIFFRITPDLKEIVPEKSGAPDAAYAEVVDQLPSDECRYVVCHFKYDKGSDGNRSKVVLIRWCPAGATIKLKMIYAASTESFKRALQGISVDVQGGDKSEVTRDVVFEKCQRFNKN